MPQPAANRIHTTRIAMRWGDMDALGHLNNTVYFRFMEQARVEWLELNGYVLGASEQGAVIVNADCNFRRAINYPSSIDVLMFAGTPGRSSFATRYELRDAHDSELLYADGNAMVVWIDYRQEVSLPLPEQLRALLSG